MAIQYKNDKRFLILDVTKDDMTKIGSPGRCDYCNTLMQQGKYIAVLNSIYCDGCFPDWYKRAERSKDDAQIEEKRFIGYLHRFNV